MKTVLFTLEKFWIFISSVFRTTYPANKCGHTTKIKGLMKAVDYTTIMTMPLAENDCPDYCLDCIGNMSIQCAWCGKPITVGTPITLYIPDDSFKIPEYAVSYTGDGTKALVGCISWDCTETGADMCGRWMPPGKVERMMSPLEMCIASIHNGTPSAVIIGDTRDPRTISVHPIKN